MYLAGFYAALGIAWAVVSDGEKDSTLSEEILSVFIILLKSLLSWLYVGIVLGNIVLMLRKSYVPRRGVRTSNPGRAVVQSLVGSTPILFRHLFPEVIDG